MHRVLLWLRRGGVVLAGVVSGLVGLVMLLGVVTPDGVHRVTTAQLGLVAALLVLPGLTALLWRMDRVIVGRERLGAGTGDAPGSGFGSGLGSGSLSTESRAHDGHVIQANGLHAPREHRRRLRAEPEPEHADPGPAAAG
ncbi:MAG: hypothetical protein AAF356_09355 [Planctomycetota bacterium]